MALIRILADGTEVACHKCGKPFKPGSLKVLRPSIKPGVPGSVSVGGKATRWVHEACSPTRTGKHGTGAKRR